MILKNKQKGIYSVEFAIVASVFFVLFFAVIEGARLMYTWNVLTEISRRGARLATVCYVHRQSTDDTSPNFNLLDTTLTNDGVLSAATFADINIANYLTPDNLQISYLDINGAEALNFTQIHLVRAKIVGYQHRLLIPFFDLAPFSPPFTTTLPVESLGVTRYGYTYCS